MATTIKDIAALAGVSRGTVDRVLNNRGSVNPATAEKINEIAKALDYKPNKAGLALAAQKKKLKLGVVLFSTDNPFFADVLKGIYEKADDLAGYNCAVLVKQIPINVDAQLSAIDELLAQEVNGIAIAPQNDERIRTRINELSKQGIPVVTFNTDIENSTRIAYVGSNYTKSGRTAAADDARRCSDWHYHWFIRNSLPYRTYRGIYGSADSLSGAYADRVHCRDTGR